MKRTLWIGSGVIGAVIIALVGVLWVRTSGLESRQLDVAAVTVPAAPSGAVENLSKALTFKTQSAQDGQFDPVPFQDFRLFLLERYPGFYGATQVDLVDEHTIVATWKGRDPALPHLVFLAHQDVVPIADPEAWAHPPFSGKVVDGYIWGRGAIDDKGSVIAYHEAVDNLVAAGFQPDHTVHFVFSHNEELGGTGAQAASEWLRVRKIEVEAIYDEGLIIADGLVPGVAGKVGLIGTSERGYVTLEVVASGKDGHASMPPPGEEGAVSVLASALRTLEENPLPPSLDGPGAAMFEWVAPEMEGVNRVVFANQWLFGPVIRSQMTKKASTNAVLRTTFAATMLQASPQENVLPSEAIASVNYRLHPRDSVDGIRAWTEATINDPRVTVRLAKPGNEPSREASTNSRAFRALQTSFAEVFPGMPIAPALFIAATDSRWMQEHTDDIYRFQPVPTTGEDLGRIHGVDERLAVEDFGRMIVLYERLLKHSTTKDAPHARTP